MENPVAFRPTDKRLSIHLAKLEGKAKSDFINEACNEKLAKQTTFEGVVKELLKLRLKNAQNISKITKIFDELEKSGHITDRELEELMEKIPKETEKINLIEELEILTKNLQSISKSI
jgi:hypothetical protein